MKRLLLIVLLAVVAGVGYVAGTRLHPPATPEPIQAQARATYVCPMHSHIVSDHPGACPICGMALVLAGESVEAAHQIHIDTATQQKLGLQLASVTRETLHQDIQTYATVVADDAAVLRITANVDGVVQRLHIHAGQRVARGQLLYELSSPDALAIQYEYIDLLRRFGPALKAAAERHEQAQHLMAEAQSQDAAAREQADRTARQIEEQSDSMLQPMRRDQERITLRLRQIGFSDEMLAQLNKMQQAFPLLSGRAPQACVVKEVMARPGMAVGQMTELLSCVDTARTWIEIALYPDQRPWVREGDSMTLTPEDGEPITTRLTGLDALPDTASRAVRARVPIAAVRAGRLGDYVRVTIHAAPREVLAVPKGALIRTGHGNFVMRAMGNGHFMPVKVLAGIESEERVAIREGLKTGDQVVVNGQFLLDAAASITDAAQRMQRVK